MDDYSMWLPKGASTFADEIDLTMYLVHVLMAIMLVVWGIFFIYFVVKFRKGAGNPVVYSGFPKKIIPISMIAFVILFDAYMLIGHDIPFWRHIKSDFPKEEESTRIRVVAQQFAWNIHYPGEDGIFGKTDPYLVNEQSNPIGLDFDDPAAVDDITTVGELRIPVNKPVMFNDIRNSRSTTIIIPVFFVA